jgi:hypothetical protein
MDDIDSNITAAKEIVTRLVKCNADVASATEERDASLYKFFSVILKLDERLRNMGKPKEARKALKARYGVNLPASKHAAMLAIKLTYPNLAPKACSKYAAALRFVRRKKKPGQSVTRFMRAHGGINGCVAKEKKSRPSKPKRRARQKARR